MLTCPAKTVCKDSPFQWFFPPIKPHFSTPAHPAKERIVVNLFMIQEQIEEQNIEFT